MPLTLYAKLKLTFKRQIYSRVGVIVLLRVENSLFIRLLIYRPVEIILTKISRRKFFDVYEVEICNSSNNYVLELEY